MTASEFNVRKAWDNLTEIQDVVLRACALPYEVGATAQDVEALGEIGASLVKLGICPSYWGLWAEVL